MNTPLERINDSGPEVYRFPEIDRFGFTTFVSGRGGGVSPAPFDSLNTDTAGGDEKGNVEKNLRMIMDAAGLEDIWAPLQVHGDNVVVIDSSAPPSPAEADAVVVKARGLAASVRTADCLPILFADPVRKVAAAAHAGRRSTELYIARKTVEIMARRFGCDPKNIRAALGPRIGACCYEVDGDTAGRFHACCGGSAGRTLDIEAANLRQLKEAGLETENIITSGVCVSCENERFFSYRKDGGVTGRFMSGIAVL